MCDTLTNALVNANTFAVQTTNRSFVINTECKALAPIDAFNIWCLIPNLNQGSICDVHNYTGNVNFLFNKMQVGDLNTIPELPLLWSSAPILKNNDTANYVDTGTSLSTVLGLLSPASFNYFIISANSPYIILGLPIITDRPIIGTDVIVCWGDGFIRQAGLPVTAVWSKGIPYMALSPSGNIMMVETWVWTSFTQTWTNIDQLPFTELFGVKICQVGSTRYVIWYGKISSSQSQLYIMATSNPATQPLVFILNQNYPITNGTSINYTFFLTVTSDQNQLMYTTMENNVYSLHFFNLTNLSNGGSSSLDAYSSQWNSFFGPLGAQTRVLTAVTLGNVGATRYLSIANTTTRKLAEFQVNALDVPSTTPVITNGPLYVDSDITGKFAYYTSTNSQIFVRAPGQITYSLVSTPGGFVFNGTVRLASILNTATTGTLFLSLGGILYRNVNGSSATWLTDGVQLYSPLIDVSDIGSTTLNTSDWNPGPDWFLGSRRIEVPKLVNLPYTVTSLHSRYQIALRTLSNADPTSSLPIFKFFTSVTLDRSNDFFILRSAAKIRLFADANIQAINSSGNVIWQNNMHDGVSNNDSFVEISNTRPGVSPSEIYLTHFNIDEGIFQMFYYAYNNILFRDYGKTSDSVFLNSITAQTNFCFDNLQIEPNNPNNIKFSDLACTCIGGQRLFDALFINVDLMPPSQQALLLDSLPCIMLDCSKARVSNPPTNYARLLADKCTVDIIICSVTIRAEDQSAIGGVGVVQNCGDSPLPTCVEDTDCPIGSICSAGKCITACGTDSDCTRFGLPGYICQGGVCIPGPSITSASALSTGAIVGIVVGVVVIIIIVSVLLWYFLVKKKQGIKPKSTKETKPTKPQSPKTKPETKPIKAQPTKAQPTKPQSPKTQPPKAQVTNAPPKAQVSKPQTNVQPKVKTQ
jgi:hypothetical protein